LKGSVGIEIRLTRLVGTWKLGQNREERDRVSVAQALAERGDALTSEAMLHVRRPED